MVEVLNLALCVPKASKNSFEAYNRFGNKHTYLKDLRSLPIPRLYLR